MDCGRFKRGGLRQDYCRIEITVVDLIAARAAEELRAIHVHGDLVPWRHGRGVRRRVGRSRQRVAGDYSACHTGVEAGAG